MSNLAKAGGFALQPRSMDEAMRMAEMLSGSQMVPKNYQGKPQDTLVAMMMGDELGLNPIQSLQNIAVINGKPSIYGDALLALVQNHPKFGGHEEEFDKATMTAKCTVWRKGDAQKHTVIFSQDDAKAAKLWGKSGPWTQYPQRMLMWRARGFALRDKFADALGGLITVEEARDMEEVDITPREPEPAALPHYAQDKFEANLPKWQQAIEDGKLTADEVIDRASTKGALSDEQIAQIREVAA
ncbi:hypothetical protein R84981_003008 [Carnimonas sp. R-84981]|uniref:hypothetical protein n=1 Tax=Carnimonas bestiolae TaxID=3402172 RepID=UPI003EDC1A72